MVSVCDRTLLSLDVQAIASQMRAKGGAIATELDISQGMVSQILSKANLRAADFRKQKRTQKSAKKVVEIECDRALHDWLELQSQQREIPIEQIVLEILESHKQQGKTGDEL